MKTSSGLVALAGALLICVSFVSDASQADVRAVDVPHGSETPTSRADTLWIFDADFEDLTGDNAGWVSEDLSDYPYRVNYWHKDTIRINGFEHLGDSTWWCGTYNDCWRQPRGYGNDWTCYLTRAIPSVEVLTNPGDELLLQWDQRVAMEQNYDYGYVDVSGDGGSNWTTIAVFDNPGFARDPGTSQDWDSVHFQCAGHQEHYVSDFAGTDFALRFRVETDGAYSSQDQYNNPPRNTCLDGAWQIDNISLQRVSPGTLSLFFDACEEPGDNGWVHDDLPSDGQTGVVFERHFESFDGHTGWMMAAYDSMSGTMVDGQRSRLLSPPIDIAGAPELVIKWEGWYDLGATTVDRAQLNTYASYDLECLWYSPMSGVWYESSGGPTWIEDEFFTDLNAGKSWLGLRFYQYNIVPNPAEPITGLAVDRARVGIPLGTATPDCSLLGNAITAVHPNPFNPTTTVQFTVAVGGHAALRVCDVAGRVVRTLFDARLPVGEHEATWNGTDDRGEPVASGVYMLRLEVEGGESASVKAVLLK